MPPPKKPAAAPVAVVRKSLLSSTAYSNLSDADKKESHRLEFLYRPAVMFGPDDYLYHSTPTSALAAIKVSGLKTRDALGLPKNDLSKDAFISAAKIEGGAGSLSTTSTMLRFKASASPGPWKSYGGGNEVRTMSAVPANILLKRSGANWVAL